MSSPLGPEQLAKVKAALAENPSAMTMQLARHLGVPEAEVLRAMPTSVELDAGRWQELFAALEGLGEVTVIVSNGSVTCEVNGAFGGFSTFGEFFNVQTPTLDLHVRYAHLAAAFAVEKPGHLNGNPTLSVQFFDMRGDSALKVFLNFSGRPTAERQEWFRAVRERFGARS